LKRLVGNYKIVVVDASSTDETVEIVEKIAEKNKQIAIIKNRPRGAKGADIMYAFSKYDSRLYGFIDSDIVSSIDSLEDLLKYKNDYDVVIGSRYADSGTPERPKIRLYISTTYNRLLSVVFNDGVKDHQCGFKLFNKKAVELIREYSVETHWPWDTEALLICKYGGLKICERKIKWEEVRSRNSDANIRRAISDVYLFIVPMARMFYRFRIARVVK
jgi:glycosyltransferase AglD